MANSKSFDETFLDYLKDPEIATQCLNAILAEYKDDELSQKLLLQCLRDIAHAQGGISKLAETKGLGRESLYKTLSTEGNPRLTTLKKIAKSLGFEITFSLPINHD